MYKSPVSIMETAMRKIVEERDNEILYKIQSAFDVDVDKDELIRALKYDRDQYEKGYADGKADAMSELVRCKDCKHNIEETECFVICSVLDSYMKKDDFCSYGERGNAT